MKISIDDVRHRRAYLTNVGTILLILFPANSQFFLGHKAPNNFLRDIDALIFKLCMDATIAITPL